MTGTVGGAFHTGYSRPATLHRERIIFAVAAITATISPMSIQNARLPEKTGESVELWLPINLFPSLPSTVHPDGVHSACNFADRAALRPPTSTEPTHETEMRFAF